MLYSYPNTVLQVQIFIQEITIVQLENTSPKFLSFEILTSTT